MFGGKRISNQMAEMNNSEGLEAFAPRKLLKS
jgi:hypothetical protein